MAQPKTQRTGSFCSLFSKIFSKISPAFCSYRDHSPLPPPFYYTPLLTVIVLHSTFFKLQKWILKPYEFRFVNVSFNIQPRGMSHSVHCNFNWWMEHKNNSKFHKNPNCPWCLGVDEWVGPVFCLQIETGILEFTTCPNIQIQPTDSTLTKLNPSHEESQHNIGTSGLVLWRYSSSPAAGGGLFLECEMRNHPRLLSSFLLKLHRQVVNGLRRRKKFGFF